MGDEVKELLRWLCALSLMRETGALSGRREMLSGRNTASGKPHQIRTEGGNMTYNNDKISACLKMLDDIEVKGTDNMLKILFIKQTLQNPVKEEKEDASGSKE